MNLFTKQKQIHREWTYSYRGEGRKEGTVKESGVNMYTLLYLQWITNKGLLHSTGNSAQYHVTA